MAKERIAVTCLGSGAALGGERLWSSLLLDERILFGLPPTAVPQLYHLGKDPTAIDYLFICHRHADHFFGLPFYLLLYRFLYARTRPLYVIGPAGMEEATVELCEIAWPEFSDDAVGYKVPLSFVEVDRDGEYAAGELRFRAVKMVHFGMDAYGFRFRYKGREVAFTGDTEDCPQLDSLLGGADLVITEFTHAFRTEGAGHLGTAAVSRIVERVRARGAIVLATHLGGEPAPIDGLTVCRDGETYLV